MAARRADQLAQVGLGALGSGDLEPRDLVRAIAAMLAEATKKPTKKSADSGESKLAVSPRDFFETIRREAGDKVLCEPYDARWFPRLGRALQAIHGLDSSDAETVAAWLNAGGMRTWPTGVPTFAQLINNLDKWIGWAREWDRRGRNTLHGKTNVGLETSAEATDFSAFRAPRLK